MAVRKGITAVNAKRNTIPDVVLYGEPLPDDVARKAELAIRQAYCLIVGGTSLQVTPAAYYVSYFQGDHMIVINKEKLKIPLDENMDMFIQESLGDVFREIEKML